MEPKDILNKYYHFAVVGVSTNKEKFGYKIYQRLKDINKQVSGISPIYNEIDGDTLYPSLEAVNEPIDVVVFVVKKDYVYDYLDEMTSLGIHYAWMQPNTYDQELLDHMKEMGITPIEACILVETQK